MAITYPIVWDDTGKRFYETGVDHGVLFVRNTDGTYKPGIPWNGLTGVTESPEGAEASDLWADNIKYATLYSAETFSGTIEAYTYPEEFAQCDGSYVPADGVYFGQQGRNSFGFAYRTKVGNDAGLDSYKLHIIYNAKASPSEKSYETVNDSPDAITFSWEITTVPENLRGHKPVSSITIDASKLDANGLEMLKNIEDILYGTESDPSTLPSAEDILDMVYTHSGSEVRFVSTKSGVADRIKVYVEPSMSGTGDPSFSNPLVPIQIENIVISRTDGEGENENTYTFDIPSTITDNNENVISVLYGGSLNATTGEITITHVRYTAPSSATPTVSTNQIGEGYIHVVYQGSTTRPVFAPKYPISGFFSHGNYSDVWSDITAHGSVNISSGTNRAFFNAPISVVGSSASDVQSWINAQATNGTPVTWVYEIAEPIVISNAITPQSIAVLSGENVFSSTHGEIEVLFREG